MPRIGRTKDPTRAVGHCWPPCPEVASPIANTVFVDGIHNVLVVGDSYVPHAGLCGLTPPLPPVHKAVTQPFVGSPSVFAHGIAIVRDSDPLNCGDVVDTKNTKVFVNGPGYGGPEETIPGDIGQSTGFTVGPPVVLYESVNIPYVAAYAANPETEGPSVISLVAQGCEFNIKANLSYTPLIENYTERLYESYPGPPVTDGRKGADLPSWAPPYYKKEITINNFEISIFIVQKGDRSAQNLANLPIGLHFDSLNNPTYGKRILNGNIYPGINFNYDTGEIYGQLDPLADIPEILKLRIRGTNYIGPGPITEVLVGFSPLASCR